MQGPINDYLSAEHSRKISHFGKHLIECVPQFPILVAFDSPPECLCRPR